MNKSTAGILSAIIFLVLTLGGYYFIWSGTKAPSGTSDATSEIDSTPVSDISDLKTQADKLVAGTENNAGLPIPEPTGKLGKANPFATP